MKRIKHAVLLATLVVFPALPCWAATPSQSKDPAPVKAKTTAPAPTEAKANTSMEQAEDFILIPELLVEDVPVRPSDEYVWVPGSWERDTQDWTWVPGKWITPPDKSAQWRPGHWKYEGSDWQWEPGYWAVAPGYYVTEDFIYDMSMEPSHAFEYARTNLENKKPLLAAFDIREAANFIRVLAGRELAVEVNPADVTDLYGKANTLDELATKVKDGSVTSNSRLEKVFIKTEVALARHYRLIGVEDADASRMRLAGKAMKNAVYHLRMALDDKDVNAQNETTMAMKLAFKVGDKFISGEENRWSEYTPASNALRDAISLEFGPANND